MVEPVHNLPFVLGELDFLPQVELSTYILVQFGSLLEGDDFIAAKERGVFLGFFVGGGGLFTEGG